MPDIPYIQTSVFVDNRYGFGGNQLATFWNAKSNESLNQEIMQGIALEMNFSESTFIEKPTKSDYIVKVRIFTPARELRFAGHPTIGTAFVLKESGILKSSSRHAIMELGIGPIPVDYLDNGAIRMKQNEPEFLEMWGDKVSIASALGISSNAIDTRSPMQWVSTGFPFLMVPMKSLEAVKSASPNSPEILSALEGQISKQIVLFSTETENSDSHLHVRMFGPEVGVVEDPATGSAAGPLAAYVEQYNLLNRDLPGQDIIIEQGYEIRRPSRLTASIIGEKDFTGVYVSGLTRLVAKGTFFIE
ncbi:MAG: PhzF family phenazine biosynthesis protein, partial [Candidatus Thorarchaeota archaeon]